MAHPVRKFLETKQYRSADRVLRRVVGRVAGLKIAQENNGGRGGTFAALVACVCVCTSGGRNGGVISQRSGRAFGSLPSYDISGAEY